MAFDLERGRRPHCSGDVEAGVEGRRLARQSSVQQRDSAHSEPVVRVLATSDAAALDRNEAAEEALCIDTLYLGSKAPSSTTASVFARKWSRARSNRRRLMTHLAQGRVSAGIAPDRLSVALRCAKPPIHWPATRTLTAVRADARVRFDRSEQPENHPVRTVPVFSQGGDHILGKTLCGPAQCKDDSSPIESSTWIDLPPS